MFKLMMWLFHDGVDDWNEHDHGDSIHCLSNSCLEVLSHRHGTNDIMHIARGVVPTARFVIHLWNIIFLILVSSLLLCPVSKSLIEQMIEHLVQLQLSDDEMWVVLTTLSLSLKDAKNIFTARSLGDIDTHVWGVCEGANSHNQTRCYFVADATCELHDIQREEALG